MFKKIQWVWLSPLFFILLMTVLFSIEESRAFLLAFFSDSYAFIKKNIIAILTAFFLVKGKFVINLFLRKILLLSATGLGKRYMIERVLNHQIKSLGIKHVCL